MFSSLKLSLFSAALLGAMAFGASAQVVLGPPVKAKTSSSQMLRSKLTFSPSEKKIALDDCSNPAKDLNQYVITKSMPTSISMSNATPQSLAWLQQNSSWSLSGGPSLRIEDEISIRNGQVVPAYLQTTPVPYPVPGPDEPPRSLPDLGFIFQVETSASPSATSNDGWDFPASNGDFGVKTFTHTVAGVDTQAKVSLFYPSKGYQHPDGGRQGIAMDSGQM